MSDILDKLRAIIADAAEYPTTQVDVAILKKAVAEIERLRAVAGKARADSSFSEVKAGSVTGFAI